MALCFDGSHHRPLEQLDALDTTIVAQPIHFADPRIRDDGTGSFVPAHEDFGRLLQGRENVRFGVCGARRRGLPSSGERRGSVTSSPIETTPTRVQTT